MKLKKKRRKKLKAVYLIYELTKKKEDNSNLT